MRCTREEADSPNRLLPEADAVIPDAALSERRRRYRGVMEVSLTTSSPGHFISSSFFSRVCYLPRREGFVPSPSGAAPFLGSVK